MHSTLMLFYSSARCCRYACIIAMCRQDISIVGYYLVRFFLYGTALHRSPLVVVVIFSFLLLSALLKTDFALTLYYAPVVLPCVLSCSCLRHWFVVRRDSSRSCVLLLLLVTIAYAILWRVVLRSLCWCRIHCCLLLVRASYVPLPCRLLMHGLLRAIGTWHWPSFCMAILSEPSLLTVKALPRLS